MIKSFWRWKKNTKTVFGAKNDAPEKRKPFDVEKWKGRVRVPFWS